MKKTGRKWRTDNCGRCHKRHEGYSGKLDADGVEYVVCGVTNRPMNVGNEPEKDVTGGMVPSVAVGLRRFAAMYFTKWEQEKNE